MVLNPDVTVRAKGVIEKCSFCIQRIQEKKLEAKLENRKLRDGDIKTACQQGCPADAIVFGDLNDENSKVAKMFEDERNYHILEEIHTLPSVGYLTKVTNRKKDSSEESEDHHSDVEHHS
jgi:molybdopterin-containing oxidoreductase family iron-sulfur binding subunit